MTTQPTKHKQTIISPHFFETDFFPFKKKQAMSDSNPGHLSSQAHSLPSHQVRRRCKEIRIHFELNLNLQFLILIIV